MYIETIIREPYEEGTWFTDEFSFEYPEHWATDEAGGPRCLCESGWLPLADGGFVECWACGVTVVAVEAV